MPVVQWVAHVLRATFLLALNLAIVTGLFLLSAYLGAQPGEGERNAGLFVRGLASFWLYIAAWSWLVRGVFKRPAPPAQKAKPTGAAVARSTLGCLANLVPVPFVFIFVGRFADWAWAGIRSDDIHHPARDASDRLLSTAVYAFDHAGSWVPWAFAGVIVYRVVRAVMGAQKRRRSVGGRQAQDVNQVALQKLKRKAKGQGQREILAPAGAASATVVGAAHAGAHGSDVPRFTPGSAREDRQLGALKFSSSDGGWWAHRDEGGFPIHMAGGADGPDVHALDLARQAVQRSFEILLRASEAARPIAQSRGVGLPRFTIAAVRVAAGSEPDVSLHLRCDADAAHEYVVRSTDKLQTFKAG